MMVLNVLISMMASTITAAIITIRITAAVKRELMNHVEEMCELNIEQSEKIKECSIKNIEMLVRKINPNRPG